jgi:hypothetical protein
MSRKFFDFVEGTAARNGDRDNQSSRMEGCIVNAASINVT